VCHVKVYHLARQKIRENDKENALRVILKLLLNTISGIFFFEMKWRKKIMEW